MGGWERGVRIVEVPVRAMSEPTTPRSMNPDMTLWVCTTVTVASLPEPVHAPATATESAVMPADAR